MINVVTTQEVKLTRQDVEEIIKKHLHREYGLKPISVQPQYEVVTKKFGREVTSFRVVVGSAINKVE